MRRALITLVLLIAALVAAPPLIASLAGWNDFGAALPEAGRSVEISPGVRLNVLESGAGSPVVLVHGLPGSAYDWKPRSELLVVRDRSHTLPITHADLLARRIAALGGAGR
jgi:hypothetical protein